VALKSTIVGEPTALLVTVILPATLPAAVGLYAAVRVALVPGAKLAGSVIPEIATPETEGVTLEIVTCEVPIFCRRIVCVVSLPTTTFPKLTDEGVAASVEDVAVALMPITMLESLALLVMETLPVNVAADVGLYVTVKVVDCPPFNVIGAVIPETLTPVPEDATFEIATAVLPVFANLIVCVSSLPTATLPKAIELGVAVSSAADVVVPVPLRATSDGEPSALLAIVIVPVSAFPAVGLKTAEMEALWPALSDIGSFGPEALNPVPATEIPETVSISVPLFVTVTVFVALCPTAKFPKLTVLGDISIEGPVTAGFVLLPVTPTQPDVTKITSRATAPEIPRRMDLGANRRERIAPLTRPPSRMGARVITTRILYRGRLPELLAGGTHLGQGHYPVRQDRLCL
jgi:hypothetical protein